MEIQIIGPTCEQALVSFFREINTPAIRDAFSPHPFSDEEAALRSRYQGKDLYCVTVQDTKILAYGMLRGWDEGFAVPSLGICVHPEHEGQGLGTQMMDYLVAAAESRGAKSILLKVRLDNLSAIHLYKKSGFELAPFNERYLRGTRKLGKQNEIDHRQTGSHSAHHDNR